MKILRLVLRLRPTLWLLGVVLTAHYAATFWERGISYDDGGLGTASFLVYYSLGGPYVLAFGAGEGLIAGTGWILGYAVLFGFYFGIDRLVSGPWRRGPSAGPSS